MNPDPDFITSEDAERMTVYETCRNCGARITDDGKIESLRCWLCGFDLHGEERAWFD